MADDRELSLAEALKAAGVYDQVAAVFDVRPCHVTGMHQPDHHRDYSCQIQRAETLGRVMAALKLPSYDALPRRLHEGCGWCVDVPSDEKFRNQLRATYVWAGVPIPEALAEPGVDVPRPGDSEKVWAALTEEFQTWQDLVAKLGPGEPEGFFDHQRLSAALASMEDRVERKGIGARRKPGAH